MNKLPKAITENFVVQDLNDEVLIYDLTKNKAFCLNQTSAIVYQSCDGETTLAELQSKSGFPQDLIHLTLSELERNKFIEISSDYVSSLNGMLRREAVKKVGLATMIALPIITSVSAPSAANAASTCSNLFESCVPDNLRQSNCCDGDRCGETNFCTSCLPYDRWFLSSAQPVSESFCNSHNNKNLCCNSGNSRFTNRIPLSYCFCP